MKLGDFALLNRKISAYFKYPLFLNFRSDSFGKITKLQAAYPARHAVGPDSQICYTL